MVVCGHVGRADEYHQISTQRRRRPRVLEMLCRLTRDARTVAMAGCGLSASCPSSREIQMRTYSPVLDQFETDANSEFVVPWQTGKVKNVSG
jgi:hypothetical protein